TARKEFLLAVLDAWYRDDNAIVRQKLIMTGMKQMKPLFTQIILQGVQEGVFSVLYPEHVGEVLLSIGLVLGDTLAQLLLSSGPERKDLQHIECTIAAYTDALERVLGIPRGSLSLVDTQTIREWFVAQVETGDKHVP